MDCPKLGLPESLMLIVRASAIGQSVSSDLGLLAQKLCNEYYKRFNLNSSVFA